jgi:hypothetical protein
MSKHTISIQSGLKEIENRLIAEGHTLVPYDQAGLSADVVIISGVDSEYEEIEDAQCRIGLDHSEHLLINATKLTPDQVVKYIEDYRCGE